jgi:polyphosphate kinase
MISGILTTDLLLNMTPKDEVTEALDQLISLVAGRESAIKTNDLAGSPKERINKITTFVAEELTEATKTGDMKAFKQIQRKVGSLGSLKTLATVLMDEVVWD